MMQMYQPWLRGIQTWAKLNGNVREVWLFGRRAWGHATPGSDVDLAIALSHQEAGAHHAANTMLSVTGGKKSWSK
jgi:predicted nucleotidyltransferase